MAGCFFWQESKGPPKCTVLLLRAFVQDQRSYIASPASERIRSSDEFILSLPSIWLLGSIWSPLRALTSRLLGGLHCSCSEITSMPPHLLSTAIIYPALGKFSFRHFTLVMRNEMLQPFVKAGIRHSRFPIRYRDFKGMFQRARTLRITTTSRFNNHEVAFSRLSLHLSRRWGPATCKEPS